MKLPSPNSSPVHPELEMKAALVLATETFRRINAKGVLSRDIGVLIPQLREVLEELKEATQSWKEKTSF